MGCEEAMGERGLAAQKSETALACLDWLESRPGIG
jgi:hypothetical protein